MATDPSEDVHHRVPEPFHIQTNSIVHAPLSPPPSVKRSAFLPPTSLEREHDSQKSSGEYTSTRLRGFQDPRRIRVRLFLILAALLGLFCWSRGRSAQGFRDLKETANILLLPSALDGFHFIPASNPHFHYVGRWTYTPNRLRRDSNFPGAYLEFVVRNCSSIYASIQNSDLPDAGQDGIHDAREMSETTRLSFHPLSEKTSPTGPVSLVSCIDHGEHRYFHRCGRGLVAVTAAPLEPSEDHIVRLVAPDIDGEAHEGMKFEGIWLNDGASLVSPQEKRWGTRRGIFPDVPQMLPNRSAQYSGQSLKTDKVKGPGSNNLNDRGSQYSPVFPPKTLETVTDVRRSLRVQNESESLPAIKGWEDLVGDMFGVNHVSIAVDGLCLTSPCISSPDQPVTVKDAFFRSGPPGSASFVRSWNFRSYIPDAMVLVLGSSDEASFRNHYAEYGKTMHDLRRQFEDAYVQFVQTIRRAAYPLHPAAIHDYLLNADGFVYNSAPATIPIFVVSPFTGEMFHSSQRVVQKLQSEGDNAVFWLDTSGWFSSADFDADVDDPASNRRRPRLNAQGNRKAAVSLHAHLCHYLADDQNHCPFLKHEAYTGKVYVPIDAELDKLIEESKVRKLKALFWKEDGNLIMRSN